MTYFFKIVFFFFHCLFLIKQIKYIFQLITLMIFLSKNENLSNMFSINFILILYKVFDLYFYSNLRTIYVRIRSNLVTESHKLVILKASFLFSSSLVVNSEGWFNSLLSHSLHSSPLLARYFISYLCIFYFIH